MGERSRTMMKKVLSMLLAVCLLLSVFSASALAEGKGTKKAQKIEQKIEKAAEKQDKNQLKTLSRMVDKANRQIEKLVRTAQKTPYDDIDWLQTMVASVTAPVFAYAESIGATVECTYTTYYIDGQYVDVDPLRVINVIPSGNGGGNGGGGGK